MRLQPRQLAAVAALSLMVPLAVDSSATAGASARSASGSVSYPAYHRVHRGDTLWSIARDFLAAAQDKSVTRLMTRHEVRQIEILNKVRDPRRIRPGDRLLLAPSIWDVPDGKVGWGTGFSGCTEPNLPPHPRAPYDGMTIHVRLVHPPVNGKFRDAALVVVRNRSTRTRSFDLEQPRDQLFGLGGTPHGALPWTDGVAISIIKMAPGSVNRFRVAVPAYRCGDTPILEHRLPKGHYDLYAFARWSKPNGRHHMWVTPANEVWVTR